MREYSIHNGKLKLILLEIEEPNYGRMLYKVKIEHYGKDVTKEFEPNWNKILYQLDKFEFSTKDSRYCFFPFESGGVIYDVEKDRKMKLKPYPNLEGHQNYRFIGNKFSTTQFVIVTNNLIQMINLNSQVAVDIISSENTEFEWINFIDNDTIEVSVNEIEVKGSTLRVVGKKKLFCSNL